MDALLAQEQRKAAWTRALLVQVDFPTGPMRLCDSGFVVFDAGEGPEVFYSEHPVFGLLEGISGISAGAGAETVKPDIEVLPRDDAAAALMGAPGVQGSRVRIWRGAADRATGQLVGRPTLLFQGEIDQPSISSGTAWSMTLGCGTQQDLQVEANTNYRLSDAFHRMLWPNERGLANVSNVRNATRTMEWRT